MSRSVAIGDIHGCARTLKFLVEEKLALRKDDHLFLLGDYVNKGPDSKGVIDYVLKLKSDDYNIKCLRGNHDQLMIDAWKDEQYFEEWISAGGNFTLRSFDCRSLTEIPSSYYSFLSMTSYFAETKDYLLVHAGFNFNSRGIYDDFEAMLTVREMDVDLQRTGGKRIVHGHVPVELAFLQERVTTKWKEISVDTGCAYTDQPGKGYLSALILETHELVFVENKEI